MLISARVAIPSAIGGVSAGDFRSRGSGDVAIVARMYRFLASLLLTLGFLGACSRSPKPSAGDAQVYPVKGLVLGVNEAQGRLRLKHDAIPGFMEAMTMEFQAAGAAEVAGLTPGDVVEARLRVTETQTRIFELRKTGRAELPKEAPQAGRPETGAEVPDASLTDDSGAALRLSDLRGKVLAVTFIYTRCPLPDFCPRMNGNFAASIRDVPGGRCLWLSVTIDPANDTPAVLAEYAKQFSPRDWRWKFATGDTAEVGRLAKFAGVELRNAGAQIDHNLRTLIIGPDGRLVKLLIGNDWKPAELAGAMNEILPPPGAGN